MEEVIPEIFHQDNNYDDDNDIILTRTLILSPKLASANNRKQKVNDVIHDINEGMFCDGRSFNKRSERQRLMKEEIFDTDENRIYKINQSGFYTHRPLKWLVALEKYVMNTVDTSAH